MKVEEGALESLRGLKGLTASMGSAAKGMSDRLSCSAFSGRGAQDSTIDFNEADTTACRILEGGLRKPEKLLKTEKSLGRRNMRKQFNAEAQRLKEEGKSGSMQDLEEITEGAIADAQADIRRYLGKALPNARVVMRRRKASAARPRKLEAIARRVEKNYASLGQAHASWATFGLLANSLERAASHCKKEVARPSVSPDLKGAFGLPDADSHSGNHPNSGSVSLSTDGSERNKNRISNQEEELCASA